jgi:hypothetical protein
MTGAEIRWIKIGRPPQDRGWRGFRDASKRNKTEEEFPLVRLGKKRDERKSASPIILSYPAFGYESSVKALEFFGRKSRLQVQKWCDAAYRDNRYQEKEEKPWNLSGCAWHQAQECGLSDLSSPVMP